MLTEPIEIKMSAHDIALARMYVVYIIPLKRRSGWIILAVVFALSLAANFMMGGDGDTIAEVTVGFLALGGSWFLLNYTRERGNKSAARMYTEGFSLTQCEEGLLYQVGEAFEILPWAKFNRTIVSKKWFYLYFTENWALIIPRSAFSSAEKFRAWISSAQAKVGEPAEILHD